MDCRSFRQHHLAYVDDTLPGDLLVAAERHVQACPACRAQDTLVRRSLLLARNLPAVECSADFEAKLEAKLAALRCGRAASPTRFPSFEALDDEATVGDAAFLVSGPGPSHRARAWRATPRATAMAASLLLAAGAGVAWRDAREPAAVDSGVAAPVAPVAAQVSPSASAEVQLAGAPASAPADDSLGAVEPAALSSSAMMVPASMGASVWPAAILAGEMPVELLRARVHAANGRSAGNGVTLVDLRR